MTSQRKVILEELRKVTSHPNADEIFLMVRKRMPSISFGTVYRNLRILKELGLVMELDYGKSFSRFDGNTENHYHFRCLECDRVFDVEKPVNRKLDQRLSQKSGFQVDYHRLEFYGRCNDCRQLTAHDCKRGTRRVSRGAIKWISKE